jgi:hypothetical protein
MWNTFSPKMFLANLFARRLKFTGKVLMPGGLLPLPAIYFATDNSTLAGG